MQIAFASLPVVNAVKAHAFYTDVLGFVSVEFEPDAYLAIVASPEDPDGPALLLEPVGDSFAKDYQEKAFEAGLPIIIFSVKNLTDEIVRLKSKGVRFRDDLARKEYGLDNIFEDTCGNFIMLQEAG